MRILQICSKCHTAKESSCYAYRNKALGCKHRHCRECTASSSHAWYLKNKEKHIKNNKEWDANNYLRKKAIKTEHIARTRVLNYCNCCSRDVLLTFYEQCPEGYHVDHIKRLSKGGLHCIQNMQYLTASEHGKKSCYERYYENTNIGF